MSHTKGWILSNNEQNDTVIQKDDESDRFQNDDEATTFLAESYNDLLEACKETIYQLKQLKFDENGGIIYELQQAISKAEGK